MKSLILITMLAISTSLFSQQAIPAVNTDYLAKSKNQKKIAWLLTGGGAIVWFIGFSKYVDQTNNEGATKGIPAMIIGGASVITGIILFKASSKNKKRDAAVGFRMEKLRSIQQQSFVYHSYPALSLKFAIQ